MGTRHSYTTRDAIIPYENWTNFRPGGGGGRVFGIIMPNRAGIFLLSLSSGGHARNVSGRYIRTVEGYTKYQQESGCRFSNFSQPQRQGIIYKLSHKPHGGWKRNRPVILISYLHAFRLPCCALLFCTRGREGIFMPEMSNLLINSRYLCDVGSSCHGVIVFWSHCVLFLSRASVIAIVTYSPISTVFHSSETGISSHRAVCVC